MNDIRVIMLKNGGFALVDADVFAHVNQYDWYGDSNGYASRYVNSPSHPRKHFKMQFEVVPAVKGMCIDHVNGFKRDNMRRNLRVVTKSQNSINCHKPKPENATSQYRGVSKVVHWRCRIVVNGKEHTSYHKTEEEAARRYNELAQEHHGEFARPNVFD